MAKSSMRESIKLTSVDDLFSTEESRAEDRREKVMEIPLAEISDFPNHPFKVKADESMLELTDSIKIKGLTYPAIVRPKPEGGYEMLAGHRRKKAFEILGLKSIPCFVRNLDDDSAILEMVDSNLQREYLLPSEKAFAYKMRMNALRRKAGRPDKNSPQIAANFRSDDIAAKQSNISGDTLRRYIRLTELISPILEMVDDKKIALNPASELSYLAEKEQEALLETMQSEDCTPSLEQAQRMKKLSQDGRLNIDVIFSILTEEKPNQKEKLNIKCERIDHFFPKNFTEKQKEDLIVQLLEGWYKKRQRDQEQER